MIDGSTAPTRIWIVSAEFGREEHLIARACANRDEAVFLVDPKKILFNIVDQRLQLRSGDFEVSPPGVALIRQTRGAHTATLNLVKALGLFGAATIESYTTLLEVGSKFNGLIEYLKARVPIPNSLLGADPDRAEQILLSIGFPLLHKPIDGSRGHGIRELHSVGELSAFLELREWASAGGELSRDTTGRLFFQQKLNIADEYRVLVLGYHSLGIVRKKAPSDTVARNAAQGAEFVQVHDRRDLEQFGEHVALLRQRQFAGVDIVETREGNRYLLECNCNPGFATFAKACPDVNIPALVADYLLMSGHCQ